MISRSGDYIAQIRLIGGRVFEKLLSASGADRFNGPQGKILDALWQQDGLSANEISQRTGLANSTLTSMLDRMESAGLVVRRRSAEDRRVIRIFLGPEARVCRDQYTAVSEKMTDIYFRGFTEEEVAAFERSLLHVLENVREADRNPDSING
jgi:DNA-binding MarR family transcriptional regulator